LAEIDDELDEESELDETSELNEVFVVNECEAGVVALAVRLPVAFADEHENDFFLLNDESVG
jgi:hypothetical protein